MHVFVKLCGLTCASDLAAALAAKPDAIGFVFWPGSPRAVSAKQVKPWTRDWPPDVARVGVFVNERPEVVARIAEQVGLDILQLHGDEPANLYRVTGRTVWCVRRLGETPPLRGGSGAPNAYVIDSASAVRPGGTGVTLDWSVAADFVRKADRPVVLAGGLSPANVASAIRRVRPWGVDVSSGIESSPGRKDRNQMMEFVQQCRGA